GITRERVLSAPSACGAAIVRVLGLESAARKNACAIRGVVRRRLAFERAGGSACHLWRRAAFCLGSADRTKNATRLAWRRRYGPRVWVVRLLPDSRGLRAALGEHRRCARRRAYSNRKFLIRTHQGR